MKLTAYGLIILISLACSITCYCQQITLTEGGANKSIDSNKSELRFVWVENARVRKEPNLKAEVVTQLKGGVKLMLTGEKSTNKIKVKLRGVDFEDIWVKVKTDDAKEGWVFNGMLTDNESRAKAMNDFLIVPGERVGHIKLGCTQKEIGEIFGKEFITPGGGNYFESDEIMPGFTVFNNSPFALECPVDDSNRVFHISIINQNDFWQTADSIKNGMTLDALAKLNRKPIDFSGMGWDFGGQISDLHGGYLIKYDYKMSMILGYNGNEDMHEFMGDKVECSTTNKRILGRGIKIFNITIFNSK